MFALLLAAGCGSSLEALRPRAAFDMNCPEAQLEIVPFPGDSAGVRGCGRRASFRRVCAVGAFGAPTNCAWLLQSAITDESPPPPAPMPAPRWQGGRRMHGEPRPSNTRP